MFYTRMDSPLGPLTLVSDGEHLTALYLEGQRYFGEIGTRRDDLKVFDPVKSWLARYFSGQNPSLEGLPLKPAGSPFRQRVYALLKALPLGETRTYSDIARELNTQPGAKPTSARAVGGAVGHNPISIILPCHRVLGAKGALTGYAGGLERKTWLLKHEGVLQG